MCVLKKNPDLPIPKGARASRSLLVRHANELRRLREEEWSYESIHEAFLECYGEVFSMSLQVFRERARRVLQKELGKEAKLLEAALRVNLE
ncbi:MULTISPECIES: hypothetical protein [Gluconobacter]|uniref:Uncharacterized protein n=1 Tax=Gluconobacter wancherniae NBRC 103581 TaxID=656744 RepID=A0A511B1E8_9PROT|nr:MULTISPECIES: hypothetical protein [Gluconobacter]MBF0853468.1 hypothetical protein [Gluconobacter wancherniae]MBS0982797.1 hypothetical protein [Gluconobacter cerinus]GBD55792.1 hypothetical protein NBRC103581_00360 [Gluconobacter wancherniae NBRC 103581]GBR66127.1 hypothetical protein AA103581_2186 [Gluconobacter wancherniae NBRC 103581]GEK93301.1 hypothetical protein GWA01_10710 [Gluconobacter wancherniae NBRC 103581]